VNLHSVVSGAISAVNPPQVGTVRTSTGYTVDSTFKQVPTYATVTGVAMQVQPLSADDLKHLEMLNVQGVDRAVYMNGTVAGVQRVLGKGGDLLTFGGFVWKVVAVLEPWDTAGWVKVGVKLQLDAAT